MAKYNNVLLKLSGEALANGNGSGYDYAFLNKICDELISLNESGVKVNVVVGGGNFWRARQGTNTERSVSDQMGMLATVMNALCLKDALTKKGAKAEVLSSIEMDRIAKLYTRDRALKYLDEGKIVIFAGGTGNPYFSTDTAAALRAAEIGVDVILLAKNVDGVYTGDPKTDKTAKKYDEISYMDFIKKELKAMDTTAVTMCMENKIPVLCFLLDEKSIIRAADGENIGTWIK